MNLMPRIWILGLLVPALTLTGCETVDRNPATTTGAVLGTAAGALAGGIIGSKTGGGNATAAGAVIGGLAGGLIGGGIGHYLDKRARRYAEVQNVQVEKIPAQSPEEMRREYPNDPTPPPPQPEHLRIIINSTQLFEQGSSALRPGGSAQLDEIARVMNEQPDERVIVRGYTSSEGGDEANQRLSERRASAVRNHLMGRGVDGSRVTAIGMGESNPMADNSTEAGRAQNRRVEIEVFPSQRTIQQNQSREERSDY